MPGVALIWRDEADGAVQVLVIVPTGEGFYPCLGVGLRGKALGRPIWAVFAGSEQRLGKGIVVADAGSAVRGDDAQLLHCHLHGGTLHWAAVVGVQDQWARDAALG